MKKLDPDLLKEIAARCPAFQARATARALTRFYSACFKSVDLTAEKFSLLAGIGATEGVTVIGLALDADIDATTISRNLQNLEARGLVQAEGGRGRSGKRLRLTKTGRVLMIEATGIWRSTMEQLVSQIGETAIESANDTFHELATAAKAALQKRGSHE